MSSNLSTWRLDLKRIGLQLWQDAVFLGPEVIESGTEEHSDQSNKKSDC